MYVFVCECVYAFWNKYSYWFYHSKQNTAISKKKQQKTKTNKQKTATETKQKTI